MAKKRLQMVQKSWRIEEVFPRFVTAQMAKGVTEKTVQDVIIHNVVCIVPQGYVCVDGSFYECVDCNKLQFKQVPKLKLFNHITTYEDEWLRSIAARDNHKKNLEENKEQGQLRHPPC